jgi:hypothetical protein
METIKYNRDQQTSHEPSQDGDESKLHKADQQVNSSPRDRSHTAAVMDTDKA